MFSPYHEILAALRIYITLQIRERRRGSSNSGDFRQYYRNHRNRHSKRRQTFHSHQGLLLPPGIPPAYPATGYTAVYSSSSNMEDRLPPRQQDDSKTWLLPSAPKDSEQKTPVRRVGSDPPSAGAGFLSVPKLQQRDMGSTKRLNLSEFLVNNGSIRGSRHDLWLHPHAQQQLGSPSSAAPSEDVSPECVSPAVMLVPPPPLEEEVDTDYHAQPSPDEIDVDVPRTSTLNYSVDSESAPRYRYNLRSTSGSSSDIPQDTDVPSGDTNPRQTSTDTTQPYTSETDTIDTVPSSSQPSVEDPNDAELQQSPTETSVETIAVPVVEQLVPEASKEQEASRVKSSCECLAM
ncbi:hypothetical protein C0J52_15118 [Blattella germanica]|nr:hypothetical protein C0J52_15118 [Blattella germanica]